MRKLLWKPSRISWKIHVLIAIVAVAALMLAENLKIEVRQPYYHHKIRAAKIMKKGMNVLKQYRIKKFGDIDSKIDPIMSGIIGSIRTVITSKKGDYEAKLTTINPNWAAVIVDMLKKARVRDGSTIAVSFSGSFPAINLAVLSASRAMNLKVIIITSIAASTWGANNPEFTWLDMERVLYESRLFPYRSVAATMGGVQDLALNLTDDGRRKILSAAQRNNIPLAEHRELSDEIDARMSVYQNKAGDTPIAAYINVGGGISAIGSLLGKKHFNAGLNQAIAPGALKIDSVMSRFAKSHTPVIFMINIRRLAKQYGLPVAPRKMQKAGEGAVFMKLEYNRPLIIGLLFLLGFIMLLFVRMGIGYRLFAPLKIKEKIEPPKHMV